MYKVLLIEDDPMVQEINKQYVERNNHYKVTNIASNITDAEAILKENDFDLLLIDDNLQGESGVDFIEHLRKLGNCTDFIMLTANNNMHKIMTARQIGGFDYIIKPFTYERLEKSLVKFHQTQQLLSKESLSQDELDMLYHQHIQSDNTFEKFESTEYLEKGINKATLDLIIKDIQSRNVFVVEDIVESLNLSHVTIRKYIRYLEKNHYIESRQEYGEIGRPLVKYRKIK